MVHKVAYILMGLLFMSGCVTNRPQPSANALRTYKDCFRFMVGDHHQTESDDAFLFKVAAESSMDRYWLDEETKDIVLVIKLDSLNEPYSAMRGAQDNGAYYLFVPNDNGFEHVGTMEGNSYKWGTFNGKARFTTSWHMSSTDAIETVYGWNGSRFEVTAKTLYRYNPADDTRKKIKDYLEDKKKTEPKNAPDKK